jgi:drug/metabolite transporter (DMT)-like permease
VLAAWWLKEPLTRRGVAGVVLTLAGVCCMLWHDEPKRPTSSPAARPEIWRATGDWTLPHADRCSS